MRSSILLDCWLGGCKLMNLGEWFCKLILNHLGYEVRYHQEGTVETEPCLMVIASDFHRRKIDRLLQEVPKVVVWGAGTGKRLAQYAFNIAQEPYASQVRVYALRGPITAQRCGAAGVPLCDPAFLLPSMLPVTRSAAHNEVLYVPHWWEREGAGDRLSDIGADSYLDVIMEEKDVLPTIQRIINARFVLTSTLHTAILCIAYGVPWAVYLSPTRTDVPQPIKWRDTFASMGCRRPRPVANLQAGKQWWATVGSKLRPPDVSPLLACFPHEEFDAKLP